MHKEVEEHRLIEKLDVEKLVSRFLAERTDWLMTTEGADGQCVGRSEIFQRWLQKRGIESDVMEMSGFVPRVEEDASEFHRTGVNQKFWYHCVILVEDVIVDLSGVQFGRKYSKYIWPEEEYRRFWDRCHKREQE